MAKVILNGVEIDYEEDYIEDNSDLMMAEENEQISD